MDEVGEHTTDLAALEQFVMDNDDLLALEERIGRFNIFDSLGIARAEIRHSNFLAWLLDPAESHGQGSLFLRAVLMDLLKTARENGYECPLSPIELDGEEMRGVEVRREWRNIDLLITCDEPAFVIAVENKVDSTEHSGQLARYRKIVAEYAPRREPMFVFLTIDGDEPSEDDWVPYTYADIHRVLTRVRNTNATSIGDDVLAFLDHYLRLVGSRFMEDEKIDELCQRIYKNHRQALELIFERGRTRDGLTVGTLTSRIQTSGGWQIIKSTAKRLYLVPQMWVEDVAWLVPARSTPERNYVYPWISLNDDAVDFGIGIGPVNEDAIRLAVVGELKNYLGATSWQPKGCALHRRKYPELMGTCLAGRNEPGSRGDEDEVFKAVIEALDDLETQLAGVPDALRPIVERWERERKSTV